MKIVVNTRLLLPGRLDGIGWFSYQSLKRITQQQKNVHFVFLFDRPYDQQFVFSDNVTPIVLWPPARHPFLFYYWMQFSVKPFLNKFKPDLFLSPDGFLALGARCKQLPVIHDINFLHYPKDLPFWVRNYYNTFFPKFAAEATRIATVSEFSKKDISENYKIDTEKIDVVYNGINEYFDTVDDVVKKTVKDKYTKSCDYFLFVGSLSPRKNILRLVKAFHLFKKESGSNMKLLLAGAVFWGENELISLMKKLNIEDQIIFTGRVPDQALCEITASAFALAYIPYFEGFGIPLVEAMQCGVPIISANVSSLPEVAGEAALYTNPFDENEIKNAMLKIYNDKNLRADLIQKGFSQKNKFSWDKTANLLWESIEKTIS
ncbi:MAG TPA: glycosyltransferase family 1 protein [Bacteroidia bacterium]|nr:glycosyltransferase family 1 protein [Bacteroidia bacterium]